MQKSAEHKIIKSNTKSSSRNKLILTLRSTLIYESQYSRIVSLTWTRISTRTMGGVFGISYCHILCITWKSQTSTKRGAVVYGSSALKDQTAPTKEKIRLLESFR